MEAKEARQGTTDRRRAGELWELLTFSRLSLFPPCSLHLTHSTLKQCQCLLSPSSFAPLVLFPAGGVFCSVSPNWLPRLLLACAFAVPVVCLVRIPSRLRLPAGVSTPLGRHGRGVRTVAEAGWVCSSAEQCARTQVSSNRRAICRAAAREGVAG